MAKTKVTGYFNPHPWPLALSISRLGVNLTLNKGEFVKDAMGRKINDPVLEPYTGPNMLSSEKSQTEVDTVYFAKSVRPGQSSSGVGGTSEVSKVTTGSKIKDNVREVTQKPAQLKAQPAPAPAVKPEARPSSVKAFSIEEARRLGLVGRAPRPEPDLPDDTGPGAANNAPTVDQVLGEEIPTLDTGKINENYGIPFDIPTERVSMPIPEPKVKPAQTQDLDLPEPKLDESEEGDEDEDEEEAPLVTDSERKFVCGIDKRDFRFRSELEHYAKTTYPEQVDEIMKPYPKVVRKGKRRQSKGR